jgi:hypothetical protein
MRKKSEAARQRGSEAVAEAAAPRWTSEPETAAAMGVSRAALSHWRRVMSLPTPECWQRAGNDRLMYDVAACAKWRAENLEPERSGRKAGGKAAGKKTPAGRPVPHPPPVPSPQSPVPSTPVPAVASHAAAKADTERIRAKLLEIELARKEGKLLDADEVEATWTKELTKLRRSIMALPARGASELAGQHGFTVEQERAIINWFMKAMDAEFAGTDS